MKVLLPFKSQFQGKKIHSLKMFYVNKFNIFFVDSTICLEIELQLKANATIIEFFINFYLIACGFVHS